jgi:hypothetical protein
MHPAEVLGVDPYDFCSFGPAGGPVDRSREATLMERVVGVVDHYRHSLDEKG